LATFKQQVEGLTNFTISSDSNPNLDELNIYLQHGIREVITRCVELDPEQAELFGKKTLSDSGAFVVQTGKILSVEREHDSTTILRPCIKIPAQLRYEAADSSSLHYRSKYNPAFYVLEGKIYSVPAAAQSGDNELIVTQVHYDTGITHNDSPSGVENFPEKYTYLISLYAGMKSAEARIAELHNVEDAEELAGVADASLGTALDYVQAEDSELSAASVQIANSQIQKGGLFVQGEQQRLQALRSLQLTLQQQYFAGFPGQLKESRKATSVQLMQLENERRKRAKKK
jgi:hypothetical protein